MVDDLLELRPVHREHVLEVLDLLQEVLRQILHGPWRDISTITITKLIADQDLPLRDGGCLGPIPTMMDVYDKKFTRKR